MPLIPSSILVSLIDANKERDLEKIKKLESHFNKPITLLRTSEPDQFKDWD